MRPGVYATRKKNGEPYYRSSITYQNKHISLGSFPTEEEAARAYADAARILRGQDAMEDAFSLQSPLSFGKVVSLMNFRDNHIYFKNPIYLKHDYFIYYISRNDELKFDIDDLFYYSSHKIMRRKGHLFVNDYGMQTNILSRYGIKNYAVAGRDYYFANEDPGDFRYSNIIIVNKYYGVTRQSSKGKVSYKARIHINGYHAIGNYPCEEYAAIAYNKAVDLAKKHGIAANFPQNYIEHYSPREYATVYRAIEISKKYVDYLKHQLISDWFV